MNKTLDRGKRIQSRVQCIQGPVHCKGQRTSRPTLLMDIRTKCSSRYLASSRESQLLSVTTGSWSMSCVNTTPTVTSSMTLRHRVDSHVTDSQHQRDSHVTDSQHQRDSHVTDSQHQRDSHVTDSQHQWESHVTESTPVGKSCH